VRVLSGREALHDLACLDGVDVVVNAVVGAVGLEPTLAALERGRALALANKESLVVGGEIVRDRLRDHGGTLLPIDSEHSAAQQCLAAGPPGGVRRLILTASGGPFLRASTAELRRATPADALRHPTWQMGRRISVDSATLVNKGFEVIEAHYLFSLPYERIDVVVHPSSLVHAFVEYADGSLVAGLSSRDMRIPIQNALTYPQRVETGLPRLDLARERPLAFEALDPSAFPAFQTVMKAARRGGRAPAAVNAADEILVERFLAGEIPFPSIAQGLESVLDRLEEAPATGSPTLAELLRVDAWAREEARDLRP